MLFVNLFYWTGSLGVASGVEFIKFTGGDGDDLLMADNPIADEGTVSVNFDASGGNGNDVLLSSNGNDTLSGDRGNDIISGGNGNDRIIGAESSNRGRAEIDTLTGGAGQDTVVRYKKHATPFFSGYKLVIGNI